MIFQCLNFWPHCTHKLHGRVRKGGEGVEGHWLAEVGVPGAIAVAEAAAAFLLQLNSTGLLSLAGRIK